MRVRLEKKNRVTTSFIQMEVEGHSLIVHDGKIGKSGVAKSNKHCGTNEKAIEELNEINDFTFEYYEKGEYIDDYCESLGGDLPTLYYIEDN
jgi:hypothetical protein